MGFPMVLFFGVFAGELLLIFVAGFLSSFLLIFFLGGDKKMQ